MGRVYLDGITVDELVDLIAMEVVKKMEGMPPKEPFADEYLTADEAAAFLRISKPTLHIYAKEGHVQKYKFGKRVLYQKEDLKSALTKMAHLKYKRG